MRRRQVWPGLVLAASVALLLDCVSSSRPVPPAKATPSAAGPRRAVLVSFDGVAGERLSQLLERGDALPAGGFRRIAARGYHAVYSVPPTPSLTAVSHVTHVTGSLPAASGIVSNTMLDRSRPFPTTISGFAAPIRAETLWQAARRQGKRTGVMLYPGADGTARERTAEFGMAWPGDPIASPKLQVLEGSAWQTLEAPPRDTFSPGRRASVGFGRTPHAVVLTALDGTDDGHVNYDRLLVKTPTGQTQTVRAGEWFPAEVPSDAARTGAWCMLLSLAPDLTRTEVYLGGLHHSVAYPGAFLEELDERVGFWPGPPDSDAFGVDSGRPEVFLEQAERISDFVTRAEVLALARTDWDLMLMYNPVSDETGHEFLLADPRQPGFTPERSRQLVGFVERGYAMADRALRAIDDALSPQDSIFVTSDHGMTPLWKQVYPNEILRQAGFVKLDAEGKISPESAAVALTSSGIAHVHVNPSADRAAIVPALENVLRAFRSDGESPWERIVERDAAGSIGLRAPESGDLIVLATPGVGLSSGARPEKGPVGIPEGFGGHGYLNTHSQLHATFLAAGPGIPVRRVRLTHSWEIAACVSGALGIEPPRQAAPARW